MNGGSIYVCTYVHTYVPEYVTLRNVDKNVVGFLPERAGTSERGLQGLQS